MSAEWIKCDLYYSDLPSDVEESELAYPVPEMDAETRERFGETYEECQDRCNYDLQNEISIQVQDEIDDESPDDIMSDEEMEAQDERIRKETARRFLERDPEAAEAKKKCKQIQEWLDEHPVMVAWSNACNEIRKRNENKTFTGQGLAKPGVQIEVNVDGVVKRFLIGHINPLRGVCDDCSAFKGAAPVLRYRVLIPAEELA